MKNLIICLLFSCSFLLGNSAIASELSGVTELTIIASKTGQTVCVFELPKGYQLKGNTLEITVSQEKGTVVYSMVSSDSIINLPNILSGTLYVTMKVNDFVSTQKITLL